MTEHVRGLPHHKPSAANLENLKAEIVDDITTELKEFLAKLLADEAAARNDRSVTGFCRRWSISRFLFYDMQGRGEGPPVMHVGGRTLISPEAEAKWVKEREAAALVGPKRIVGRARKPIAPLEEDQPSLK
jgi:hypothetical protein